MDEPRNMFFWQSNESANDVFITYSMFYYDVTVYFWGKKYVLDK